MEDLSGCFNDTESVSNQAGDYMEYHFYGNGIIWTASTDILGGIAEVWIDGVKKADDISLYPDDAEFPGMSRGHEKRYRKTAYAINGLYTGEHVIRIVVTGKRDIRAQDCYISIDALTVLTEKTYEQSKVNLYILSEYNYPRIVFGNYAKEPVYAQEGYTDSFRFCLCAKTACADKEKKQ